MRLDWQRFLGRPRTLGQRGEAVAARFLKKRGYKIVARSHRTPLGELDLIAVDPHDARGPTLVFVEVKTRTDCQAGHPAEAVDWQKQHKLTQLARHYRVRHNLTGSPARFDVVAILWPEKRRRPEVVHYRDAFDCPSHEAIDS